MFNYLAGEPKDIYEIADNLFKMKEGAESDFRALHNYINEMPSDTPWFFNTITALLRANGSEYHHLNIGYEKSGRLLAWACRNLLEINLYTEYSSRSAANAKRFADDQFIDALDVFSSFKQWMAVGPDAEPTPILDETIAKMEKAKAASGVTRTKYTRTEDIAKELTRADEYKHSNKVTSKLIHPTAYSLLLAQEDSKLLMLKPYLYRMGTFYFASTQTLIKKHIEKLGTAPPA